MEHLRVRVAALFPARMHVDKGSVFAEPAVGLRGDADAYQIGGVLRGDLEATRGKQNVRVRGRRLAVRQAADEPPESFPPVGLGLRVSTRTAFRTPSATNFSTSGCVSSIQSATSLSGSPSSARTT